MDDLISRQAAIDEVQYEIEMINHALDSLTLDYNTRERLLQRKGEAREILDSIETLPTVDAVPVVRCRDCKYSYIFEPWEGKNAVRYCNQFRHAYAKDSDLPVREEGFCSYGERREE